MKVAVIGTGSWGTSLAQVLADNKHDVTMYGIDDEEVNEINSGKNTKFFEGTSINPHIKATTDLKEAVVGAKAIVLVVPTKVTSSVLSEIVPFLDEANKVYFINASKGFDPKTNDRMSNTIRAIIPEKYRYEVASIIGPSHAEEVILRMYTAIASVSIDLEVAKFVQKLFSNDYVRLYTLQDEVGAEYGVAIKNILALCSGIISGIGLGDNTRAALLTRGLAEMIRYGMAKGGEMETYLGLTGIGDLIVTATSPHSRNFQAGYKIGQEGSSKSVMDDTRTTIEGVRTCKVIYEDGQANKIDLPIINACYHVLFENEDPKEAIKKLMNRDLTAERYVM
ncbi:NAD(P)-dependent glycerol-3-phosphate dehydrogenase [Erysipelotrichaceae bacterium OttesenSCG-928-M19]|nr:NAD(P)-dependent glycerol-3-phosphate dehydrogenase [Erysipelotrichaceae bacterium OttesenSCG-928-M19]